IHHQLAFDLAQDGPQGIIKPDGIGGGVELPLSNAQGGALIGPGHAQAALYATTQWFRSVETPRISTRVRCVYERAYSNAMKNYRLLRAPGGCYGRAA